jgi:protein-L-isoaspartate(D-aspartate) O-methyltransferase
MIEMNFETARHNMIEQQIRPWQVIDPVTLDTLEAVPRENFVNDSLKESAFSDVELPIGHNQVMLPPKMEAKILQAVQIKETDKVLEVGTGSGYMTALIAHLADSVTTVEIHEDLSNTAKERLQNEGYNNINFVVADAANGYDQDGPYDVIILTGSVPSLPENFKNALKAGGRLFAVIGTAPVMEATLMTRISGTQFATEGLFETEIPELENVAKPNSFTF